MHKTPWGMAFALAALFLFLFLFLFLNIPAVAASEANLVEDPSFEESQEPNQFGHVFKKWGGWKHEGDCSFAVGQVAHSGKTSGLLRGATAPKIRLSAPDRELEPGRYRITAWIRGLDISTGTYNATTEFMFNEKYMQLQKNGTFGWTQLTYVAEIPQKKIVIGPSFGLMAPGFFWIDDVVLEKVGADVALTEAPVLGKEEAPIAPPEPLGAGEIRCGECGYRNLPAWGKCYACGVKLGVAEKRATGPAVKLITSFEEEKNPFSEGGVIVAEHATDGKQALRIDVNWGSMDGPQNWLGYDFLKADIYTDAKDPAPLGIEIRDAQTDGYWTRVNYNTIIPPGASTLVIPVQQLYVGEKSRPGRMLLLDQITRFVFIVGEQPQAPVFVDNLRLERDDEPEQAKFEGLVAYDLGPAKGPVMEGFTQFTPATVYSPGRGFGLKDAKVWRPDMTDVLQPDPLYQDFLAIEQGGIAVDVPNGKYKVFVNIDMAGGFWGEVARYKNRKVLAEGHEVANETLDFEGFRKRYFRFWDSEDLPTENTFDKFQKRIFSEKTFEVNVQDGQLNVDFEGSDWSCAVSCFIAYPTTKAAEGEKFLKFVENRRRFHFDNYFKRILHRPTGDPLAPTEADQTRGYVAFDRDFMRDLYYNDTPLKAELGFLAVNTYGAGVVGINAYERDLAQMNEAGFQDFADFLKSVYTEVQRHAEEANWLPVYWNLGDEPLGDALVQSAENAEAYRQAFPKGPPYFTAATSFEGRDPNDPHFRFSKALHLPTWNLHSEDGIQLLQQQGGGDWAFYNGGNRWTFGDYMYKAVKQFNMKFRITWHWNAVAGDPYYALDCREDDYAWCNCSPDGTLIPSLDFERTREGVDDYRRLLTLARLCKEKQGAAAAGETLIADRMAAFKLGQRDHDPLFGFDDWKTFRAKVDAAIDALRK